MSRSLPLSGREGSADSGVAEDFVLGAGPRSRAAFIASWTEKVPETDIQIVSNEAGEATAVIVPIALWKEIASERETAYLLKSETMRQRLLAALERGAGVPIEDAVAKAGL